MKVKRKYWSCDWSCDVIGHVIDHVIDCTRDYAVLLFNGYVQNGTVMSVCKRGKEKKCDVREQYVTS